MTIRGCKVCGGIVADHLEIYAGTPCTCDRRAASKIGDPKCIDEWACMMPGDCARAGRCFADSVPPTTSELPANPKLGVAAPEDVANTLRELNELADGVHARLEQTMTAAHPTRTAVPAAEDASPSTMPPDVEGIVAELRDYSPPDSLGVEAADALVSLAAENAKLREIDAMRIETVRYTFQQLSLIVPDDDDNRPLDAHARMAVAAHAALRARVAELEDAIAEHNKRCERECDSRLFGSLPRRYLIEVPK